MASKKNSPKEERNSKPERGRLKAVDEVRLEMKLGKQGREIKRLRAKHNAALALLYEAETANEALLGLQSKCDTFKISPKTSTGESEATAVMVASDWHVEERVKPSTINMKNRFDLDLAKVRANQFFQNGLRLVEIMRQATTVKTLVLALLGDFITNDIHEELVELNQLPPMDAAIYARDLIASGIEFLLKRGNFDEIVIPCHSGNHGRTTKKVQVSTERGHSLEYFMFDSLARHFKDEPRVKFVVAEGYHSYLQVHGMTIRFHHGHEIRYQGGVGGIFIPANKAIAQWNKVQWADLDVFGHFHQMKDGGNFVSNGSLIGFNAYALSIKADYEHPKQAFFLIDRKRGRTITAPIVFDDTKKDGPKAA